MIEVITEVAVLVVPAVVETGLGGGSCSDSGNGRCCPWCCCGDIGCGRGYP